MAGKGSDVPVTAPSGEARDEFEVRLALANEALCQLVRGAFGVSSAIVVRTSDGATPDAAGLDEMRRRVGGTEAVAVIEDVAAMAPQLIGAFAPFCARAGFCAAVALLDESNEHRPLGALVLVDGEPRRFSPDMRRSLRAFGTLAAAQLGVEATARREREQADLYRLLADNSTDTIVRGNLDGIRLYVSPSVHSLLGYEPDELVGRRARDIVHPDDLPEFRELMQQIRDGRIEQGRSEQRQRHKDGRWVWLEAFIRLTRDKVTGEPDGYVVSVRDISRRKAAEMRLAHLAAHDALTGLANRSLLQERLNEELAQARETGAGFAVLCLDLDRFKQVNDKLGHEAGDAVLCAAAERFRRASRKADLVARLGGDEFVVVLATTDTPLDAAERLATRIIDAMRTPIPYDDVTVDVGVSVGIAVASPAVVAGGCPLESLLRAGDHALYAAKAKGRACYVVASEPVREDAEPSDTAAAPPNCLEN